MQQAIKIEWHAASFPLRLTKNFTVPPKAATARPQLPGGSRAQSSPDLLVRLNMFIWLIPSNWRRNSRGSITSTCRTEYDVVSGTTAHREGVGWWALVRGWCALDAVEVLPCAVDVGACSARMCPGSHGLLLSPAQVPPQTRKGFCGRGCSASDTRNFMSGSAFSPRAALQRPSGLPWSVRGVVHGCWSGTEGRSELAVSQRPSKFIPSPGKVRCILHWFPKH
ncbi:uncharacterized protein SCHCODRAFT_02051551 [Schizophyllum commune H4-8]|uniref:uncharacterized protein n=1 Tax=Schizophyllum commune (strain H4-8 / FGSC 9210) TaxID=578458 RepID=UPI00215FA826|nr:uncharacterized protein SCHCODRAFT_02051551 [Schizophyllum commune H4-8]KAI5888328.1 hypothetical protein SCHCODRAFT_02051551 [Schizophyllum commune H4-8]